MPSRRCAAVSSPTVDRPAPNEPDVRPPVATAKIGTMIEKGREWGEPVELRGDEPTAHDDAELTRLLTEHPGGRVLLAGGDLHRSLGGQAPPEPWELPIDVLEVDADGVRHVAVAHVVARRPLWAGEFVVAMGGTHLGEWNLGPKAHPNDGLVDVTFGRLGPADRLKARRRAPSGSHLPHPGLRLERRRTWSHAFARPVPLRVDGVPVGRVRNLRITVHPDAGSVVLVDPPG